jgi:hypothetical protein
MWSGRTERILQSSKPLELYIYDVLVLEKCNFLGGPNEYSMNFNHYIKGLKIYDDDIIYHSERVVPNIFTVTSLQLNYELSLSLVYSSIHPSAYCT